MKVQDKEFIREIISSDIKQISNPDFTCDTLEKIAASEKNKLTVSISGDITFLIPHIIYASLFILLSLVTVITSWSHLKEINNISLSVEMILGFLLNPITISILFTFSLLYLIDLYLKKVTA